MRLRSLLAALLLLAGISVPAWAQSTINPNIPAQNSPLNSAPIRGNFAAAYNDVNNLLGEYGSSVAPASPVVGQLWRNTSTTTQPISIWDGSQWVLTGTLNTSTHTYSFNVATSITATEPILWSGSTISFDYTHAGTFTAVQKINLNAATLPTPQAGTILQTSNAVGTIDRFEADSYAATVHFSGVRFNGTVASPTVIVSGNEIVSLNAFGYDAVTPSVAVGPYAGFRCYGEDTWSSTLHGTYCDVAVTAGTTSATLAENVRFENDGGITVPSTVTGGDEGAGTINARGLYVGGVTVLTTSCATCAFTNVANTFTATQTFTPGSGNAITANAGVEILNGVAGNNTAQLEIHGTSVSTGTSAQGIELFTTFTPTNAGITGVDAVAIQPTLGVSAGNVANYEGDIINLTVSSAYTGTPPAITFFEANALTNNTAGSPNNAFSEVDQFRADLKSNGNGTTTQTVINKSFNALGWSGAAASGGTLTNIDYDAALGTGSSSETTNIGLHITGNGGAASTNWAIDSTSTAPSQLTGNLSIVSASFGLSGNISSAAWTTSGVRYKNVAATLTDTSSSGTVAAAYTDVWGGNTIAASSAVTFTNYYGAYFVAPVAGTNVTFINKYAIGASSLSVAGDVFLPGLATSGTIGGALCATSGGDVIYHAGASCFGASAISITPGTTTIIGSTAPCVINNSTGTTMACGAETGTGSFVLSASPAFTGTPSVGAYILMQTPATRTIFMGGSGNNTATGNYNVALGYQAGTNITTGAGNTLIGDTVATSLTSGSNNTEIGATTGQTYPATGSGNVLISAGNSFNNLLTDGSNELAIWTGSGLIMDYGMTTASTLTLSEGTVIVGSLNVGSLTATSGAGAAAKYVCTDSGGKIVIQSGAC